MLSHPDIVLTIARERQRDAEGRARALDLARAHDRGRSPVARRLDLRPYDSSVKAAWEEAIVIRRR